MQIYHHPKSLARSREFKLHVNGQPIETLYTDVADFAICALSPEDFPANVEIKTSFPPTAATVRPLSKNITAAVGDGAVRFTLERSEKLSIEISGGKPFYLFANAPETNPPALGDPSVITFPAGQITEIPVLSLEEGQTLYLPGGAVLKGRIHVKGKSGIRICGHGILDGSYYERVASDGFTSIILDRCPEVLIEDITMIRPSGWMLMLAVCKGATVRNLKEIGEVITSDGIDVVGSSDVLIEDCFLHNNDDCVVIKALDHGKKNKSQIEVNGRADVENVLVRRCTFCNWHAGNAMEIGYELSVESIRNITFTDIDVLHVHGSGAVFSIHNTDRALVESVLFENIRIEHCFDKLIDFRISHSRYSSDSERGRIRGITLREIHWNRTRFNPGCTISMIGGWDADHSIEDVTIQDFYIDGRRIEHLDELEICTRHCHGLRLIPNA